MKPYRVTLKYIIKDHIHSLSTVIPAYNENTAIKSCVDANRITGIVEEKAEEICL